MLHAKARWSIPVVDDEVVRRLVHELNISPLLARLLVVRGITDAEEAGRFLYAKEDQFHDPFLLDGMETAVKRIRTALERGEKIRIYGDYDADGVSGTSLMIGLMRTLGADFDYYIPHRQTEGYGLNTAAIEAAKRQGIELIVTIDTGISAVGEVQVANSLGIDVIVTDHHEPPAVLPDAFAVINPKKPGCSYPYKWLAGVGVAFKLAHALLGRVPFEWLEYAAIGTIADLMPLHGENRILVKLGLERIRTASSVGIRALLGVAGIDKSEVSAGHIGFSIAPRINASGRLERAETAVLCLTTENEQEAEHLAFDLDRLNRERQQVVEQIVGEALEQTERLKENEQLGKVLVLAGEDWNVGVVGIVASKVLEKYYRPTIILSIDGQSGTAKGSARSIPGFDIHAALTDCADILDHFGGHQAAAGMSLHRDKLPDFRRRLNDTADRILKEQDLIPVLRPDMEIDLTEVSADMIAQLDLLEPYGMKNPHPSFVVNGLRIKELKLLGKDRQHLKLSLIPKLGESPSVDALAFGKAEWSERMSQSGTLDVYGELSINEWNSIRKPQIMIKDLRIAEKQVFDWRGRTLSDESIANWFRRQSGNGSAARAALFFRKDEMSLVDSNMASAIWLADPVAGLAALNRTAETTDPLLIKDLLLSSLPPNLELVSQTLSLFSGAERVYPVFQDTRPYLSGALPAREQFKQVYGLLTVLGDPAPADEVLRRIRERTGLTSDAIRFILAVFGDLGFVHLDGNILSLVTAPPKKDLTESAVYQEKLHRDAVEQTFVFSTAHELKEWILSRLDPRTLKEESA